MAGKVKFSASTAGAIALSSIRRGTMGKSKGSKGKQSRKGSGGAKGGGGSGGGKGSFKGGGGAISW